MREIILKEPVRNLSAWRAAGISTRDAWQAPDIAVVLARVLRGQGFAVVRGLPINLDIKALLGGFGSLLPQNAKGDRVVQVYDRGGPALRGYLTRSRLSFYSDPGGDVIALFCVRKAEPGGRSAVVSSMTIYSEALARHTDFPGVLYNGFVHDHRSEQRPGEVPASPRVPIYSWHDGDLSCRYTRACIEAGQAMIDLALTEIEAALFDCIDEAANDSANQWTFDLEPGNLLLCNSHTTLHSRTDYVDTEPAADKRLVLRAWLAVPGACRRGTSLPYWHAP